MRRHFLPVPLILLVLATAAHADGANGRPGFRGDPPDYCRGDWGWGNVNCTKPRIAICPQGDFELINEGWWARRRLHLGSPY